MSKQKIKKHIEIAKIPALKPTRFIKDQVKFLKPQSPQEMWQNIYFLMKFYDRGGCLSKSLTQNILKTSISIIKNEPNVLYLSDPINIFGDIHGQFFDLIKHFQNINLYSLITLNIKNSPLKRRKVLFLGDYVDRGKFSVEVVMLLLILKIYQPKTFYLLRGNHQSKEVTQIYNFKRQCLSKYQSKQIYQLFLDLFCVLPLAAVINGAFLCLHGGLSEEITYLSDIQRMNRFTQIPRKGLMCDIVWSDPVSNSEGKIEGNELTLFNDNRNCSVRFGVKLVKKIFSKNQIICLIRAHEVQDEGYSFLNWQGNNNIPTVITLFSAPNYCGGINKGAICAIDKNVIEIFPSQKLPEPFVLPNFIGAFELSFPYLIAQITELFFYLLQPDNEYQSLRESSNDGSSPLMPLSIKSGKSKKWRDQVKGIDDFEVQQKILKKQEYLYAVYSQTKKYIQTNISFKDNIVQSGSKINMLKARRKFD